MAMKKNNFLTRQLANDLQFVGPLCNNDVYPQGLDECTRFDRFRRHSLPLLLFRPPFPAWLRKDRIPSAKVTQPTIPPFQSPAIHDASCRTSPVCRGRQRGQCRAHRMLRGRGRYIGLERSMQMPTGTGVRSAGRNCPVLVSAQIVYRSHRPSRPLPLLPPVEVPV